MQYESDTPRKPLWMLVLLGLGIYIAPYIFAWFTLRPGYPRWYTIVSFTYAAFLVVSVSLFVYSAGYRSPPTIDNGSSEIRGKIELPSYLRG